MLSFAYAQFIASEILPDALDQVEFWRVAWQAQQTDVVWMARGAPGWCQPVPLQTSTAWAAVATWLLISVKCSAMTSLLTAGMIC
jgi:hypothetical protein